VGQLTDFEPPFLPRSLVQERFVETGAFCGDTLAVATLSPFATLETIEIAEAYAAHCTRRFAADARVTVYHGSSPDVLPRIIRDRPTTFWLDGHFSGGKGQDRTSMMDARYGECPVLAELEIITRFQWTVRPIIAIDDVHMFTQDFWRTSRARHFTRAHWPTLDAVLAALPRYAITIEQNILYAIPEES